jgi:hypothetical protein
MDNYEIARDRAQEYFLGFDQSEIIDRWHLQRDEKFLYVSFLGRKYAVCRQTGRIDRLFDGKQAGFSEVLSIFDFLCHKGTDPFLTGKFAPVNSLRGRPVSVGVETGFYQKSAEFFDRNLEAFKEVCFALGGTRVPMGDFGFMLPVFGEIQVILKFYQSDEEFPASITFLWDENMLSFVFYETVFYVAGFLLEAIREQMESIGT